MADNVTLNSMTGGSVVATDDVGGVHYQVIKLAHGAADTATLVSTASPLPTSLTNLEKGEDGAHSSGDTGVMMLGVRNDSLNTTLAGTNGDYTPFAVTARGSQFAIPSGVNGEIVGFNTNEDAIKVMLVDDNGVSLAQGSGASALGVGGDQDHDAADTGSGFGRPVKIGGKASTSEPTAVANADRVNAYFDANGYLHIKERPDGYATDDSAMPATPVTTPVSGEYRVSPTTYADGDVTVFQADVNGNLKVSQATLLAGEDLANDVLKVEHRFSTSGVLAADALVKTGVGLIHTVTFSCNDAAPTAGTIDIYDNTAASGTKIFSWTLTTAVFNPTSIILDVPFTTGCYVDFTTTADVNVVISYR